MRRTFFLVALLLAIAAELQAGIITEYTDRSTFTGAVSGPLTVEDFTDSSHFPISTGVLNSSTHLDVANGPDIMPGDIEAGVTYSTPIGLGFFFNMDTGAGYVGGFLDGFYGGDPDRTLTVTFDSPASAFGFDTNVLMGDTFNLTIDFVSDPDFAGSYNVGGGLSLKFFGFESDAADILAITIQGRGNSTVAFALDNFTFNQPSVHPPVPEPTSLLVFGGSMLGLCVATRRRRV